jgi:hypothetical protein
MRPASACKVRQIPITSRLNMPRRTEFGFWFSAFGTLAGAVSVISLIQKLFNIGLLPILADFIGFYRKLMYPVFDALLFFTAWRPPTWYMDLYVLSFVVCIATLRGITSIIRTTPTSNKTKSTIILTVYPLVISVIASVVLLGVPFLLIGVAYSAENMKATYERHGRPHRWFLFPVISAMRKSLFYMFAAVAVFFCTNAML